MNHMVEQYTPLVSIVIPVYNGGNFLKQAIDSALTQTYENIEIVVVNDGSTDNGATERIALSYGDKVRYFHKENGGCASALNYGIDQMRGEWFSWLSHDDLYMPDKVQCEIDIVRRCGYEHKDVIIVCGGSVIDEHNLPLPKGPNIPAQYLSSADAFEKLLLQWALNGCALLIPRSAFERLGGFSTRYVYILDWIYWLELAITGYDFHFCSDVLVKNRKHDGQVSVKKRALFKTELETYAQELAERFRDDGQKSLIIWAFAYKIGAAATCKDIEKLYPIPLKIHCRGIGLRTKNRLKSMIKKILHMR